jgi:hypothetical protein
MYLPHDTCLGVNYVIRAVSTPGDNGSTSDLTPDGLGVKVYSTESTTEQYIDIPWSFVSENPGSYVITVFQSSGKAMYTLTVRLSAQQQQRHAMSPSAAWMLAAAGDHRCCCCKRERVSVRCLNPAAA